jgi:phosphoglycerate dehydrogenase-like enzyme
MKILIPNHLEDILTKRIKEISVDIDINIDVLNIKRHRSVFVRRINYFGKRYLPFTFYKKIKPITTKTRYTFSVNHQFKEEVVSDAEVLIASWILNREILSKLIPHMPNLKWIHSTTTGVDHILTCGANLDNVTITNIGNIYSKRVAEFALGLILSVAKRIPEHIKLGQERKWVCLPSSELKKATVGIIGLGNIGTELAKMTKALNMRVIAIDPAPKANVNIDKLFEPQELSTFLSQADFIVLCCTLNENTKQMISDEELKSMRKDAYLINVARGGLIDEKALVKALKERWIKGACLDVFEDEPLPPNSPFNYLDNIIITHHSAFYSDDVTTDTIDTFLKNYSNYIANKPLLNEIDF